MSLFTELKRRSVFRVAIGYVGVSWLIIQVVDTVFGIFDVQTNADELVVIILAIGFVPAMILAWVFELTPEGIKRDVNTDRDTPAMRNFGRQLDRGVIVILSIAVVYFAVEVLGPQAGAANLMLVFLINGPYTLVPLLLAWRLREPRVFPSQTAGGEA